MMWSWELGRFFQLQLNGLRLGSVGSSSGGIGYIIVFGNYNGEDLMISNWWLKGRIRCWGWHV